MKNKKGLSDVVTTVLIILLVVVAVAAVWAFIQPTLKGAGSSIERGQICLTSTVEPITCKVGTVNTIVGYRATFGDGVTGVSSGTITVENTDGSVKSSTTGPLTNGQSDSKEVTTTTAEKASIVAVFDLEDGSTQSCTSIPIDCTA